MTLEEFSNSFDTLLNSYSRESAFGEDTSKADIRLDEYEKSLYLTKAQEDIVLSLYGGRNSSAVGFEETEELRRYLSNLVCEKKLAPIATTDGNPLGMESSSKFFTLPASLWFITYESVVLDENDRPCKSIGQLPVVPVRQDEYHKVKNNPFRGANDKRSLRLDLGDGVVEIISKYKVIEYYIRYLRKAKPIVLIDLPDGLTVQGEYQASNCELHSGLHQRILDRAVIMALQSKGIKVNSENK